MAAILGQTYRITLDSETDIVGWRSKARQLLAFDIEPDLVQWTVAGRAEDARLDMFGETIFSPDAGSQTNHKIRIERALLSTINTALLHSAHDRFGIAYDVVFRAQTEPKLHQNPADAAVKKLNAYAKEIRRDIHKMHAFVRFRKIGKNDNREQFVAWFEPDHHIVEAVAPFFRNRFTGMDWLIVTPEASIAWNGKNLRYGPGGKRSDVSYSDIIEDEWRTYYSSIFNPARVKTKAMKSEMPIKYWKNLPEAELIAPLVNASRDRVDTMLREDATPALFAGEAKMQSQSKFSTLEQLYEAMGHDPNAPTEQFAERLVRGEGPSDAAIMVVGEQPGDKEDLAGKPFIGPTGKLLRRAMADVGLDPESCYLTNAVKRFKFVQRGIRRIHRTPNAREIEHYRWWLDEERKLVKPDVIMALGATAARALTGKSLRIAQYRGQPHSYSDNAVLFVTVHPAYLLRLPDENGRKIEYRKFVDDLEMAINLAV